ncbi:MAG: DUF2442 domain-containing protein [Caldilineaceae bacterium]|nr:DUF2442 domain-containing protein [Caldilineaceae bacterium]
MPTLVLESDPAVVNVDILSTQFVIRLQDERQMIIPLDWYPRLQHATDEERQNWELLGDGYAIHWPDLDEYIGVEGLLAGRRSGESEKSFQRWLAERNQ